MAAVLSIAHGAGIDGCLWAGVTVCCALAAQGRSRACIGRLAVGGAVLLGSLALVSPTP